MFSRPLARTLGALVLTATLMLPTTSGVAASPWSDLSFQAKTKKVTTLRGLSPELQRATLQKARTHPGASKLTGSGGTSQAGASDRELDLICDGDWFITWDEDADGNPILGTFNLHCADTVIPVG